MAYPHIGTVLNGYVVVGIYNNQVVLARALNPNRPEPWVVWRLTSGVDGGDSYSGSYHCQKKTAEQEFVARCFDWYQRKAIPPVENVKTFVEHCTAEYCGWLLAWYIDPASLILCFAPCNDFVDADFDDMEELASMYNCEYEADSLEDATDYIDNY